MSGAEAIAARESIGRQLGPPASERPRIVVSRPASLLDDNDSDDLDVVVSQIRERCEADLKQFPLRSRADSCVEHQALGPVCIDAPATDQRWEDVAWKNCRHNLPLLLRANALVILGFKGGSHTTGYEHALVPSAAPVLYVAWGDDELPTAIAGGLSPGRVEIMRAHRDEDVAPIVASFVERRWSDIIRAWHVSELRKLRYGPLAARIEGQLAKIDQSRLKRLLDRWGYRLDSLAWMTTADGLAASSSETIEMICGSLGLDADLASIRAVPMRLDERQLDALAQFQTEYEVPHSEVNVLRRAAERQLQIGVMRLSLSTVRDWREFRRQLKAQQGP